MKSRTTLKEDEAKKYRVVHNFEIHQGDSRISTKVDIAVTAASDDEAKEVGDAQMEKLMAYMRSGAVTPAKDVKPQESKQTDRPSAEAHEDEESNPQSDSRNFWQAKGFSNGKSSKGSLADYSEAEKDAIFLRAITEKKETNDEKIEREKTEKEFADRGGKVKVLPAGKEPKGKGTSLGSKHIGGKGESVKGKKGPGKKANILSKKLIVQNSIEQDGNVLAEKSKTEKQARTMAAAAHNPKFAKKVGIPTKVAKEFNEKDTGTKKLSNAMKKKAKKSPKQRVKEALETLRVLRESKIPPKPTFVDFLIKQ
jgi:hypothetical protein